MNHIMKIVRSLEEPGLLIKGVSDTIKNEAKNKKVHFLVWYQVHEVLVYQELCLQVKAQLQLVKAQLKQVKAQSEQARILNAASFFNKFNGVYSTNDLPKTKGEANLDKFRSIETYCIAFYVNGNNRRASQDAIYFDSFGVEYTPKEIKRFIANQNIIPNIYRIQAHDSIMCRYFCIAFIDFMLKGKTLLGYKNSFSPYEYEKNDQIILKYF